MNSIFNLSGEPVTSTNPGAPDSKNDVASTLASLSASLSGTENVSDEVAGIEPTTASDVFELLDSACPKSYVDQFQLLRTQLLLFKTRTKEYSDLRTICVMSTLPGEGKSFTAQNLALVLAAARVADGAPKNQRVLLMRATLSRAEQKVNSMRAPWEDFGIVQALSDQSQWPRCIQKVPGVPLYVMPRGAVNRQHALSTSNFENLPALLATLREHFEWIVMDGVAYSSSPEAAWFSEVCDGTLFVVGQGAPGFGGLSDALSQIPPDRLIGVVMNKGVTPHKRGFKVRIRLGRKAS